LVPHLIDEGAKLNGRNLVLAKEEGKGRVKMKAICKYEGLLGLC
jgi:hypothetical protein